MTEKSSDKKTPESPAAGDTAKYSETSGQSPLEWLEINEGVQYSQLSRISGERKMLQKFKENPIITVGLVSGLVAIFGGLYSIRNSNARMSNNFLKLRWASSSCVFGFVVYKIWDQIDWNPPAITKLQNYLQFTFNRDYNLLSEDEAAKVKEASEKLK